MNPIDETVLKRFRGMLSQRIRLHKLIVFGSRARGDADPDSDMDVIVVVDGVCDQETRSWVSESAWEAGFEVGIVVVPVVFSKDEWETGPERYSLLVRAVERDGVPV